VLEVAQLQGPQLDIGVIDQQALGLLTLLRGDKRHGILHGQADLSGTVIGRQPEFDLRACRRVPPVPGQDEALL
jgi:hypothetical protein